MIIDAHAHLIRGFSGSFGGGETFDCGNGEIRLLDGTVSRIIPEELYRDDGFTADTLIQEMDRAGIDKALLMQAYYYGINNGYVEQAVAQYPHRFAGVGSFDPYIVKRDEVMDALVRRCGFRAFKFEISESNGLTGFHPDFRVNGAEMEAVCQKAESDDVRLIFDLGKKGTRGFQIDAITDIARRHPGITFVVCHLLAPTRDEELTAWRTNMEKLAACENIFFDVSALPWNIREPYPYQTGARFLRTACDMVGSGRLLWGSDVPCVLTLSSYRQQYSFIPDSGLFSKEECEDILGRTAEKIYFSKTDEKA